MDPMQQALSTWNGSQLSLSTFRTFQPWQQQFQPQRIDPNYFNQNNQYAAKRFKS